MMIAEHAINRSADALILSKVVDVVFPGDTNHHGTFFGGSGLAFMNRAAYIAAIRHARADFVTVSCEKTGFAKPGHLGDIVEATGRVTRVGRRSLTVAVELTAESPVTGASVRCGGGFFHMVAVGDGFSAGSDRRLPTAAAPLAAPAGMDDIVFPDSLSHYGSLHGGHALGAMARAAFVAASRHCRALVVLRLCRRVDFDHPIREGEIVQLTPRIVQTGRSSMTVAVDLWAESVCGLDRRRCGGGEFVMVAVDESHRPIAVPPRGAALI
jgi:acyl-CoA hydrolase